MKSQKLERRLLEVTQLAQVLAHCLRDNTAAEDSPHYDRSRTWCDREEDYAFAGRCLRQLAPTERALKRKLKP